MSRLKWKTGLRPVPIHLESISIGHVEVVPCDEREGVTLLVDTRPWDDDGYQPALRVSGKDLDLVGVDLEHIGASRCRLHVPSNGDWVDVNGERIIPINSHIIPSPRSNYTPLRFDQVSGRMVEWSNGRMVEWSKSLLILDLSLSLTPSLAQSVCPSIAPSLAPSVSLSIHQS